MTVLLERGTSRKREKKFQDARNCLDPNNTVTRTERGSYSKKLHVSGKAISSGPERELEERGFSIGALCKDELSQP